MASERPTGTTQSYMNENLENIITKLEKEDCEETCKEKLREELNDAIQKYKEDAIQHELYLYDFMDKYLLNIVPGIERQDKDKTEVQKLFWVKYFFHNVVSGKDTVPEWRCGELNPQIEKDMKELSDEDFSMKFTRDPKSQDMKVLLMESFIEWQMNYTPHLENNIWENAPEVVLPQTITGRVKNERDTIDKFFDSYYGVDEYPLTIPKSKVKSRKKREELEALEHRADGLKKQGGGGKNEDNLYDRLGVRIILPHIYGGNQKEENELNKRQIQLVADRIASKLDPEWYSKGKKISDYEVHNGVIPEPESQYKNQVLEAKDYITRPKGNKYQSYHMHIRYGGVNIELQLRTDMMHQQVENEEGYSGHEGRKFLAKLRREQFLQDPKYAHLKRVYDTLNSLLIPDREVHRYKTFKLTSF